MRSVHVERCHAFDALQVENPAHFPDARLKQVFIEHELTEEYFVIPGSALGWGVSAIEIRIEEGDWVVYPGDKDGSTNLFQRYSDKDFRRLYRIQEAE